MQALKLLRFSSSYQLYLVTQKSLVRTHKFFLKSFSTKPSSTGGEDEWNDAWETAWLPEDLSAKNRAPWESDVHFSAINTISTDIDLETKAFVEDMNDNWNRRRDAKKKVSLGNSVKQVVSNEEDGRKIDYRLKKQKIHAALWMKEIEKEEEAKLGGLTGDSSADIEKILDSCSEIFDSNSINISQYDSKMPGISEIKNNPDGWETTSKPQEGNIWDISQREEDILLQEFERRIAYSKFQIASFIKSHIFSRRRPIDGWKYMIEVIGPNAKRGKGSVPRAVSLSDSSTQPFKEEKASNVVNYLPPQKGR